MPVIGRDKVPVQTGTIYPQAFAAAVAGRGVQRLGAAGGLTQFGVNIVTLAPGAASSIRHWHEKEDEFVFVLDGTCTLRQDEGETDLGPGDSAAFPAGADNGHCLVNHTDSTARFLVVGSRALQEVVHYAEADLRLELDAGTPRFTRADGSPLPDLGTMAPDRG
jgi:uncharacterized cupin superfamily protein